MAVSQDDIVRATVEGRFDGVTAIQNTFHMIKTDSGDISEALALTDVIAVLEALYVAIGAILSTLYTITGVRAVNTTKATDIGFGFFTDATPGVDAGATQSPQVCYGMSFPTGALNIRGRKSFGPILEGAADNKGLISAGALLDLADLGDLAVATFVETSGDWVLGVIRTSTGLFLPFESYTISPTSTTQRRRRVGVGV